MPDFNPGFDADAGTYTPDQLIAGDHPIRTKGVALAAGQGVLKRGTLLGKNDDDEFVIAFQEPGDDDEPGDGVAPDCILGEDVDTGTSSSGTAVTSFAYIAGDFNENQMTFGEGVTADSAREALRALSIYLVKPVTAE